MVKDDFIGTKFGEEGQLTVVGWDGEKSGYNKKYKVHCTECARDSELFGDGYFYCTKGNLVSGQLPCGCAKNPRWTEEQYKIRVKRKCQEYGDLEFLGFSGAFKGARTKLKLRCNIHEEPYLYENNSIDSLFHDQRGCHHCRSVKISKPDQKMIDSFFASGAFQEDTKFYRSDRKDNLGYNPYWNYTCPICSHDEYVKEGLCNGMFESYSHSLQKGHLSCRCSVGPHWTQQQREYQINKRIKEENLPYEFLGWVNGYKNAFSKFRYKCKKHREQKMSLGNFLNHCRGCPQCVGHNQQECYINGIYDSNVLVGLKFGIANNSNKRVKQQSRLSIFDIRQLKVFSFPSVDLCKAAEAACKEELVCGILSKQEMPDGWTETTSPLNLGKIIDIYKRFYGIENK